MPLNLEEELSWNENQVIVQCGDEWLLFDVSDVKLAQKMLMKRMEALQPLSYHNFIM